MIKIIPNIIMIMVIMIIIIIMSHKTLIALEEKLAAMQVVGRLDIEASCP